MSLVPPKPVRSMSLEELEATPLPAPVVPPLDELEVMFPSTVDFEVKGEIITVREFKFGELPLITKLLKRAAPMFINAKAAGETDVPGIILAIIAECGDDLIELLAANIKKPRAFIEDLDNDVGLNMMLRMIEVNVNFFTTRVVPNLKGLKLK